MVQSESLLLATDSKLLVLKWDQACCHVTRACGKWLLHVPRLIHSCSVQVAGHTWQVTAAAYKWQVTRGRSQLQRTSGRSHVWMTVVTGHLWLLLTFPAVCVVI